ncbi:MAG: trypsin-like serine protease [Myxococcota bacterium]
MLGFSVGALCALFATPASAVDPAGPGPSYLLGAPVDDDPAHAWSVGICQSDHGCAADTTYCSGTLVAPNLVLTARHCVDNGMYVSNEFCENAFMGVVVPEDLFVTVDPDPFGPDATPTWVGVSRVLLEEDTGLCTGDIALMVLDTPVLADVATPAWVDVETNLAADPPEAVAIVGRGWLDGTIVESAPGVFLPEKIDDGGQQRRILEDIPVTCVTDDEAGCVVPDWSEPSGTFAFVSNSLVVGSSALPGDSGSGILDQESFDDGVARVIAVATIAFWSTPDPAPSGAAGQRTSRHRSFLVAGALDAAAEAGIEPPGWAVDGALPPPPAADTADTGAAAEPSTGATGDPDPAASGASAGCGCATEGPRPVTAVSLWLAAAAAIRRRRAQEPRTVG